MGQLCTNLDSGRFALYNSGYRELSDKGKKIVFLIYDDKIDSRAQNKCTGYLFERRYTCG